MTATYATLAQARLENKTQSDDTSDDAYMTLALQHVTARIDEEKKLFYFPRIETRYFNVINDTYLPLTMPLLDATSVVTAGGVTLLDTDYEPLTRGLTPYYGLIIRENGTIVSWSDNSNTTDRADMIAITGVWGHRSYYASAWSNISTLGAAISTTTATEITVATGQGVLFSAGQFLRIGSEFLSVVSVATDTVTVVRGINGSTAATHSNGATVEIFTPESYIVRAAMRWVSYLYTRRGNFQTAEYDGIRTVRFPGDMPEEVAAILGSAPNRYLIGAV